VDFAQSESEENLSETKILETERVELGDYTYLWWRRHTVVTPMPWLGASWPDLQLRARAMTVL
jgi:hypothetical protein